jgi:uncharacterized tellurite resistance protein B-like protein
MIKDWWNSFIAQPQTSGNLRSQSSVAKQNDIASGIALLAAEVLRSSNNFTNAEEQFVSAFFKQHFSNLDTAKILASIHNHFTIGSRPLLRITCRQLFNDVDATSHKLILRFLLGVAASDTFIHAREMRAIQRIASYLNIAEDDFSEIKNEFVSKNNPYYVLGVSETATFSEVKRAYRIQILKHHPDKRDVSKSEKEATKEFLKIQHAYQVIIEGYNVD